MNKPVMSAFIVSFSELMRRKFLNQQLFESIEQAETIVEI